MHEANDRLAPPTLLNELETRLLKKGEADANASGRQEFLKNLINEFI